MGAANDDLKDFYDHGLGRTFALAATTTAAAAPVDAWVRLQPGRYLIQATTPTDEGVVWIALVPHSKALPSPVMSAEPPFFPFVGVQAIEVHIRPDHNDRLLAVTSAGEATVYATQISRIPKR